MAASSPSYSPVSNGLNHPVRQIAYFTPGAAAAARRHSSLFGSGPFFLAEHIPLAHCRHRGRPTTLDHSSAYGQWGEIMVEFVQQNNAGPSPFHDCVPAGGEGLHHVALFADDLAAETARWRRAGFDEAFHGEVAPGFGFAFIDTVAAFGHMIELYPPTEALLSFYAKVRRAAEGWDGADPIRPIGRRA